jgi:hypothetical protein
LDSLLNQRQFFLNIPLNLKLVLSSHDELKLSELPESSTVFADDCESWSGNTGCWTVGLEPVGGMNTGCWTVGLEPVGGMNVG